VLGFATLAAYIKIGIEHAPRYGEHYVPASQQAPGGKVQDNTRPEAMQQPGGAR
jgi:hypothetical protein